MIQAPNTPPGEDEDAPFRKLQAFISEQTARKPRKRSTGQKQETANELTRRIVQHVRKNGGFCTRLASTGSYRADLQKFVASQQVSGMPDVFAVVDGRAVLVEVKIGRDTLSEVQKRTHTALMDSGASLYSENVRGLHRLV